MIDKVKLENLTIMALYFKNNLIARDDYKEMRITNVSKRANELNKEYNHLIYNPQTNSVVKFVMFAYKTASKYGKREFEIPSDLRKILNAYIKTFNKKVGDWLFTTTTGSQYTGSNFGKVIQNSGYAITGKYLNVNLIRKIWIIWFFNNAKRPSINDKKAFAERFLHSKDVQEEYNRVNVD